MTRKIGIKYRVRAVGGEWAGAGRRRAVAELAARRLAKDGGAAELQGMRGDYGLRVRRFERRQLFGVVEVVGAR